MKENRIILTSRGLNCKVGRQAIRRGLKKCIGENYERVFSDLTIMLCTISEYGINKMLMDAAIALGFREENILIWDENISNENKERFECFSVCYVTEGNTFQIMHMMKLTGADKVIKKSVAEGGYYIGASAGAMIAASSIEFASDFDTNFVRLNEFEGLDLLPVELGETAVIPHYDKKQFERWKRNTSSYLLEKYNYIDYIPDTRYKIF